MTSQLALIGRPPAGDELLQALKDIVGPAGWLDAPDLLAPFLVDRMGAFTGTARLLLRPATTHEVAQAVRLCAAHGIAIVPQGGNTSLVGGATPGSDGDSVLLSLSRMKAVRAVDQDSATLTVEAGCTLADIQALARTHDRLFPLSIGSEGSAQIGGVLSTNAGGVQVLRYGMARDLVLGIEAVLPDGRVWDGLRGLRKDNTGYDLKQLFIGAEGTLGIITAAVLKTVPPLRHVQTALLTVPDISSAVLLLRRLQSALGDSVVACELLCRQTVDLVSANVPRVPVPVLEAADWYLLIECGSTWGGETFKDCFEAAMEQAVVGGLAADVLLAQSESQRSRLWQLRHAVGESRRPEGACLNHDISVPVSRVPEFIRLAIERSRQIAPGCRISTYGHIGDGNVHFSILQPATPRASEGPDADFLGRADALIHRVYETAIELHGSISAEHGIGQEKRSKLALQKSPLDIEFMRRLKNAIDPQGHMNRHKLLPDP